MAQSTPSTATASMWDRSTRALLGGLAVASAGFFHISVVQTPGLDPPPESAALFLVATAGAVVSFLLLAYDLRSAGYALSVLNGLYVLVVLAVVVSGTYGPAGSETNPLGPVAWVVLAVAVVVSAGLAWRGR